MPNDLIIGTIKYHISQHGGIYSNWYVGITKDPKERILTQHNVGLINFPLYFDAGSSENARSIEKYFVDFLKTKGNPGGGDYNTKYVYVYFIKNNARQ